MAELFITLRLTIIRPFTINTLTCKRNAAVAQSVEQGTENPCVISSILIGGMHKKTRTSCPGFFMHLSLKDEMLFDANRRRTAAAGARNTPQIGGMITYYYISI
jgi:hypothetical protein